MDCVLVYTYKYTVDVVSDKITWLYVCIAPQQLHDYSITLKHTRGID